MNHPSDVLTFRRFVPTGLDFYSFVLRLCTENEMHFWASPPKSIMFSNLFNQVTTETTHCAYAAYTVPPFDDDDED